MHSVSSGRLAFEPKKEMEQGKTERVFIRISPDSVSDLSKGFKKGPPAVRGIRVAPVMKASLEVQPGEFTVQRIGVEEKVVEKPYTEWAWNVTPLESGEKEINVSVYAELMIPGGKLREPLEAFSGSATINVHVKPTYVAEKFVRENWQWLAGSPIILGVLGWLVSRVRKRKEHHAGF